jgi:hypothetical protein
MVFLLAMAVATQHEPHFGEKLSLMIQARDTTLNEHLLVSRSQKH